LELSNGDYRNLSGDLDGVSGEKNTVNVIVIAAAGCVFCNRLHNIRIIVSKTSRF